MLYSRIESCLVETVVKLTDCKGKEVVVAALDYMDGPQPRHLPGLCPQRP